MKNFNPTVAACVLLTTLAIGLSSPAIAGDGNGTERGVRMERRLAHARELLGSNYGRSIVKTGEQVSKVRDLIHQWTRAHLPKQHRKKSRAIASAIMDESDRYAFDPVFVVSVILSESSFRPEVEGPVGEIGLMQLRPSTAEWIARRHGLKWQGKKSLKDPLVNIRLGTAYLAYLREYFGSHARLYIAAYNMGQGNVRDSLDKKVWPKDYPIRVMTHYVSLYREMKKQIKKPS